MLDQPYKKYSNFIDAFYPYVEKEVKKLKGNYSFEITGVTRGELAFTLLILKKDEKPTSDGINLIYPYIINLCIPDIELITKETIEILLKKRSVYNKKFVEVCIPFIYDNMYWMKEEPKRDDILSIECNGSHHRVYFMFDTAEQLTDISPTKKAMASPLEKRCPFSCNFNITGLKNKILANSNRIIVWIEFIKNLNMTHAYKLLCLDVDEAIVQEVFPFQFEEAKEIFEEYGKL